ncbi:MAG: fibronectin type III domain-containing protein [Flavobacterium sp. JAD_PAG50586_2]|nr:MAG: fibronectin type III domain-containing protein [Flavobacterium sp. JAD_PAG50586_2]
MKKLLLLLFLLVSIGINAQPPSVMPELTLCDANGDGFETFNLSSQIPAILNGLNANTTVVTFYETFTDAQTGINPIGSTNAYTNISPNEQVIYIRVVDNTNSEVYFSSIVLAVSLNNAGADGSTTVCDSSVAPISLSDLIISEQSGGTWTRVAGTGGTFNATNGTFTSAIGATTSTFVYTVNSNQACPSDTSVATIIINSCVVPIVCGGTFTDPAGATAAYANNSDYTVTIYPTTPGEVVTVTFTSFATETNWDALYVFNGNSIAAPQIASANGPGNVPGGLAGGYWGNVIPGPFTSSSADGSLTFRFRSDNSGIAAGWIANVSCGSVPTCSFPIALSTSTITHSTVTLNWTQPANPDNSVATNWHVIALPCGSPVPTANTTGFIVANTGSPFLLNDLSPATCYSICIRAVCSDTDFSSWNCFSTFTTAVAPPECGGNFIDNGGPTANYTNNSDNTSTICPTTPGELVTVTFVTFDTEANWDALYVFNGNSIASQQIPSTNAAANVPGGLPGGYWGTAIPGPFTSSDVTGCLTFRFRSDNTQNRPGWIANITCGPAPTCRVPSALSVTDINVTTATINWMQSPNPDTTIATEWQYLILPAGSPIPTAATTGEDASTNSVNVIDLASSTCYIFYVRAVCSSTETSNWSAGYNFCTQTAPLFVVDNS